MVRANLVSALEEMTGGRAEIGKISVVPFRFRVEGHDLTIHGKEAAGDVPYAHVDHLVAYIKIISILQREYGFDSLSLEHPVFHLIVYPDGSTNQPTPKAAQAKAERGLQQLFALSINHLQIVRGELLWKDQKLPFDLVANDVTGGLDYSFVHRNYAIYFSAAKTETNLRDLRPFTSSVKVRLTLGHNFAIANSIEWSSGHSRIEASGRLDDFTHPRLAGKYNGRIDLGDFASVAKIKEVRAGFMEAGGSGTWSGQEFLLSGKAAVRNLEWRDSTILLTNTAAKANYTITASDLKLTDIQARILGGEGVGHLQIANWLSPKRPVGRKTQDLQKGSLSLKLADVSVASLASAIRIRTVPLNRLRFAGLAGGTFESSWTGSPARAETVFALDVKPPSRIGPREIPMTARAKGRYHGATDEVELADFDLASRSTEIQASGTLSTSSSVKFGISTTDLGEWQPILSALSGPQIPVNLRGRATLNGVASGKLRDFAVSAHLQMNNFLTTAPATASAPARQIHWDSLVADVQGSPRSVSVARGLLTRGPTAIRFEVNASLLDGRLADTSPFTAHIQSRNADLSELQSMLGYDYPVTGKVDLLLVASGTKSEPHGEGQIVLTNGSVYGQPITRMTSDLHFAQGELQLNNAVVLVKNGRVEGGGAFSARTRGFRFNLNGSGFELSHFAWLQQSGIPVEGKMNFAAHGEGTLEAPVINADIHLFNLAFDHEHAGDFKFEAITRGADMQLSGRSDFEQAELSIGGTIHLREQWPADLSLRFDRLDVDSLLRARLGYHLTSHVPVAGVLQLRGPLLEPKLLNATADLTSLSAEVESFNIHNEGPIHFTINDRVLALNRLRLAGDGTDITAQGTVQLRGDHEVDIRSDGRLNLKLLQTLGPGISSAGLATVGVRVGGTFRSPSLVGNAEISKGSLSSIDLPNGLSEMNGTLAFNQDRLQIQKLSARVGGGTVDFTGFMSYSPHLTFDINAVARDVRLRPAGLSATSDADLHLVGNPRDSLLSGEVTILKLTLTPGFDFARYLEGIRQTTTLPSVGDSMLSNVRLDIHVVTTPELQMQAASAKVSGDADLHLRGTLLRPLLLGRVDIMEGDVYFSGTKYRLERGEITFTGPTGIKPTLDLEATTRVRDYDIALGVNGTPDKLNVTYRSEPPLPSADIVALLALGRTENETAFANSSSQAVSQQASSAIISQALNATLSSRSQRLFGISRIKVDPNGLNTETTPTHTAPAVTIEQQVSSNLTVSYSTEVSQASQQVIQGEYNVTRNISIVAVRDQNGVVSFDVRLRQRKK
jgi:translocation and assembly module TamB